MGSWLAVLAARIRGCFLWNRLDRDFDRELTAHLELLGDDLTRRGMTPEAARRAAALRLGGRMQIMESQRDQRSMPFLDTTLRDLRAAARSLTKHRVFSSVAIATLAVGIGAGTIIFSLASAVLLHPLPYRDPDRLVRVFETNPLKQWTRNIASPANYADWRARNTVFEDMAAYQQFTSNGSGGSDVFLTGISEPQALTSLGVTGNLFRVLGTPPLLGRTFTDEETFEGASRVVVLSYGLWQSAFAGDPSVVGRTMTLSGRNHEIVGVMPREFFFPGRDIQVWLPVGYAPSVFTASRRPHSLGVVARRRAGVTLAQAAENMASIAKALEQQYPEINTQMGVRLENFHDSLAFEPRPAVLLLSGAVGTLFLIVCVNLANLQLGRGLARAREMAIRRALGAGRGQLIRQLLTESLILSAAGGTLGFGIAAVSWKVISHNFVAALPVFAAVEFDQSVVLFTIALALAAPLVFGIVPAFSATKLDRLHERSDLGSRQTSALRSVLVAIEVAFSIVLVVGSVLLIRSLLQLREVDPGFDRNRVIAFTVTLPAVRYPDARTRLLAFREIERRLKAQPGVEAVGASSTIALQGSTWTGDATVEGRAVSDYERELRHNSITPGYFATMGIRILDGRAFDERDRFDQPATTIVNETLARQYFRGADAVGKRITFGRPADNAPWITIVGVVADEKQDGMDKAVRPQAYRSIEQQMQNPLTFVVRTALDTQTAFTTGRAQVQAVDKDLALGSATTMRAVVDASLSDARLRTWLVSAFAGIGLFLAALGIYGVLAYFVSQRARELGIRRALGATRLTIVGLVLDQALRPVAAGVAAGLVGALVLTRLAQSLLFGVQAIDPPTYVVAVAALAFVAGAACVLPALRATRVDPLVALRDE